GPRAVRQDPRGGFRRADRLRRARPRPGRVHPLAARRGDLTGICHAGDMTSSSPVEAVDRALLVLEALADAGPAGLGLAELAARLDVHKTTVHRALAALRFRDFVAQDPTTGLYVLGGAAAGLGESFFGEENLPALLHPALVALCAQTAELVHLGVLSGAQVVYVDKVEPERAVRVWSAVGRRMPAVTTALGRALLASRGASREVVERYTELAGGGADAE